MKLSEIEQEIEKDSVIDDTRLEHESLRIPMLQAKYYRFFLAELRELKAAEYELGIVRKERTFYYMGKAPDEVYRQEPMDFKVLKSDLDLYMDADEKYVRARTRFDLQKAKTELLEGFIKTLNNRSFTIKNAIEYMKFKAGS